MDPFTLSACHSRTDSRMPGQSHLDKTNSGLRMATLLSPNFQLSQVHSQYFGESLKCPSLTFTLEQLIGVQVPILLVIRAKGI